MASSVLQYWLDGVPYSIFEFGFGLTDWPTELPQSFLIEGYQENLVDQFIASEEEPEQRRRRTTFRLTGVEGFLMLNKAQLEVFENLFHTTLAGGVLSFRWNNAITDELAIFTFDDTYEISAVTSDKFQVKLKLTQRITKEYAIG